MVGLKRNRTSTVILVAEDEPGALDALALLLELEDFVVLKACDGREALARLKEQRCDVIVTDFMMPGMDGDTFIRQVRSNQRLRNVPIILMSAALPPDSDIVQHVDVFLRKPFTIARLLREIARVLKPPGRKP